MYLLIIYSYGIPHHMPIPPENVRYHTPSRIVSLKQIPRIQYDHSMLQRNYITMISSLQQTKYYITVNLFIDY
jgi:hypothetical protein